MDAQHKIWCDEDDHRLYEYYTDFNEWLDGDEGQELRLKCGIDELNQPSKAFYAGDREAYDQAFRQYRIDRRHEVLSQAYFEEQFCDGHWFDCNHDHFMQLVDCMASGSVVPFVGAGISAAADYPTWKAHLRDQGRTAGIAPDHVDDLLSKGAFEDVIKEIVDKRGNEVFIQEIRDVFSRTKAIPDVVWRISELFEDQVVTTNYDRLIEQAYDTGETDAFQLITGMNALARTEPNRVTIFKLHGDIQQPGKCILSKNQYDEAYGNATLNPDLQIPRLLARFYKSNSLLFLGSSLNEDRTVQVFRAVKDGLDDDDIPQHFSIEQAPEDEDELVARNEYLARLGITPIWFEIGRYELVEGMLRQAKNELGHLGKLPGQAIDTAHHDSSRESIIDTEFSVFLRDFLDLMPLLHWFRRVVPQSETGKYLNAMQRVFYASSIFTDDVDEGLATSVDNLLRAIANSPQFDEYSEGKLTVAFSCFQQYLKTRGRSNYSDEIDGWNSREMLAVTSSQFEELIANDVPLPEMDLQVIRLVVSLMHHGAGQLASPKRYSELPVTVNEELGDLLTKSLSLKLGVNVPDRLGRIDNQDIRELCEVAWTNFGKSEPVGFVGLVRYKLRSLLSNGKRS